MKDIALSYSLFTILLGKIVNFKHAMKIPAREVFPLKAINMHVFLCYLETRKHFSQGNVFVQNLYNRHCESSLCY